MTDIYENYEVDYLPINESKQMTPVTNTSLNVIGAGLIALGVTTISHDLWAGVIEIVLGVVVYAVYELTPTK